MFNDVSGPMYHAERSLGGGGRGKVVVRKRKGVERKRKRGEEEGAFRFPAAVAGWRRCGDTIKEKKRKKWEKPPPPQKTFDLESNSLLGGPRAFREREREVGKRSPAFLLWKRRRKRTGQLFITSGNLLFAPRLLIDAQ